MGKNNNNKRKAEGSAEDKETKKVAETKLEEVEEVAPAVEASNEEKKDSPKQRHFERVAEVMKRVGGKGYTVERGVEDDEGDDDEDDDENEMFGEDDDDEEGEGEGEEGEGDDEEIEEVGEEEGEEGEGSEGEGSEGEEGEGDEDDDDFVLAHGDLVDDDEEDDREYTEEEVAQLRHVIITDRREKSIEQYETLILGDQANSNLMMFNTSFSTEIFEKIPKEIKKIMKKKSAAEKFDELFGLTKGLVNYDVWMIDYEDSDALKGLAKQLAAAWKSLLALSDKELEIDPEFTRPGIEALMENMVDHLAQSPDEVEFEWK